MQKSMLVFMDAYLLSRLQSEGDCTGDSFAIRIAERERANLFGNRGRSLKRTETLRAELRRKKQEKRL